MHPFDVPAHPVPPPPAAALPARLAARSGRALAGGNIGALLLLPMAFVIYVMSFSAFPVLEQRYDVLGDGDSAAFIQIIRDFDLTRTYGDPYNTVDRSVLDVAQKHKIHHVLYVALASAVYEGFRDVYRALGVPSHLAMYSVNALIVCLNLLLLLALLREHNPSGNPTLPFLLCYAFALSTWVFASVPESWPFSATLVLTFFVLHGRRPLPRWELALVVGLFMLNNVMLGVLVVFLALDLLRDRAVPVHRAVLAVGGYSVLAIVAWAGGLTLLSLFDPMFRPDHFVAYTLWFREFTAHTLPVWDPYVWKSALSNLLFTSVASNQPDPFVPQEALIPTLLNSRLGLLTMAVYGSTLALVGYRIVRLIAQTAREEDSLIRVMAATPLRPAVFCAVMALITGILYHSSGFLYSCLVVPMIAVVLCRFLDLRKRADAWLLYLALSLILLNNALQVQLFREALALS